MLQQTTVAAVKPRFARFIERWPTVQALAAAPDEEVLSEWAGLGYYARARNLIACARAVAARGKFPQDARGLRELPGVGPYTASAIAAIAFGEAAPAVDTNIMRVVARLHALKRPELAQIERLLRLMMPADRRGDFVQAMMDLGATICRPRDPHCQLCPLSEDCAARASGQPDHFPERKSKASRPQRYGIAWWTERDGHVWLVRRPPRGLLGGMAALPTGEWADAPSSPAERLGTVRHVFTHFALELDIAPSEEPVGQGWWQPIDGLNDAGLPTLFKRAVAAVLDGPEANQPPRCGLKGAGLNPKGLPTS